ncbi:MAG: ribonuclease domain-containing protein [Nitrospiraceae bacterium]
MILAVLGLLLVAIAALTLFSRPAPSHSTSAAPSAVEATRTAPPPQSTLDQDRAPRLAPRPARDATAPTDAPRSARQRQPDGIPAKVLEVLEYVTSHEGRPPAGYVGGRSFENREQRLPRGRYREYDVNPKVPGQNRGAERLVIERSGKAFYTDDHYRTFTPVN